MLNRLDFLPSKKLKKLGTKKRGVQFLTSVFALTSCNLEPGQSGTKYKCTWITP